MDECERMDGQRGNEKKGGSTWWLAGGRKAGWRQVKAGGLRADGCSNGGGRMEDDGLDDRWTDE